MKLTDKIVGYEKGPTDNTNNGSVINVNNKQKIKGNNNQTTIQNIYNNLDKKELKIDNFKKNINKLFQDWSDEITNNENANLDKNSEFLYLKNKKDKTDEEIKNAHILWIREQNYLYNSVSKDFQWLQKIWNEENNFLISYFDNKVNNKKYFQIINCFKCKKKFNFNKLLYLLYNKINHLKDKINSKEFYDLRLEIQSHIDEIHKNLQFKFIKESDNNISSYFFEVFHFNCF